MIKQPYKDSGFIFYENPIPFQFHSEIFEAIVKMNIEKKEWFFIILFKNDDHDFYNILGELRNIQGDEIVDRNTPRDILEKFVVPMKKTKLNIPFIRHPKKLLSNPYFNDEEKIHFFWHFIHELRHINQAKMFGIQFTTVTNFIRQSFKAQEKNQLFFPPEYDSERAAKIEIISKFGEEGLHKYLDFRVNFKNADVTDIEKISAIDINRESDLKRDTLELIENYKKFLKTKMVEFHQAKPFCSVNVDAICDAKDVCFVKNKSVNGN